jgi:hypothetical protein
MRKFYLISLGIALSAFAVFFITWQFPGSDRVSFYLLDNGLQFGVTVHGVLNIFLIGDLLFVWLVSVRNALITIDTSHATTIRRK